MEFVVALEGRPAGGPTQPSALRCPISSAQPPALPCRPRPGTAPSPAQPSPLPRLARASAALSPTGQRPALPHQPCPLPCQPSPRPLRCPVPAAQPSTLRGPVSPSQRPALPCRPSPAPCPADPATAPCAARPDTEAPRRLPGTLVTKAMKLSPKQYRKIQTGNKTVISCTAWSGLLVPDLGAAACGNQAK